MIATYDQFIETLNALNVKADITPPPVKKVKYTDVVAEIQTRMASRDLDGLDFAGIVADALTGRDKRGVYIAGNVGSGKTERAKLLKDILRCEMLTAQEVVDLYTESPVAFSQLFHYRNYINAPWGNDVIVDDLGTETPSVNVFGKTVDPMTILIQGRYAAALRVHFTTNLNATEIKKRYGERIHSRLFEMCRAVTLIHTDRRKEVSA